MGLMRNIPDAHPVYKLLRPHVRYTMAINSRGRKSLMGPDGSTAALLSIGSEGQEELFRRAGKRYSVNWSNIKHNTKERGVDDPTKLPHYYYRDDGFKIWDALEAYVSNIINHFYSDNKTVIADKELQNFAADVHTTGFPGYGDGVPNGHDFPYSISTKSELVQICTLIMFTASAQHASVNFAQYTYLSFVPNSPLVLHHPPPTKKGSMTSQQLMNALPNERETQITVALVALLSAYSSDEVYNILCCILILSVHE